VANLATESATRTHIATTPAAWPKSRSTGPGHSRALADPASRPDARSIDDRRPCGSQLLPRPKDRAITPYGAENDAHKKGSSQISVKGGGDRMA